MITCPRCSLSHKPSVAFCDCGYNLAPIGRNRRVSDGGADVRQSAYRWLGVWLAVIKFGALVAALGGAWLTLALFMREQPMTSLFVAVLTGLSLISSVAASKGIGLLLHLDNGKPRSCASWPSCAASCPDHHHARGKCLSLAWSHAHAGPGWMV